MRLYFVLVRSCLTTEILSASKFTEGDFVDVNLASSVKGSTKEHSESERQNVVDDRHSGSQLYTCPMDGCVCTFLRHSNMENHVLYGKCSLLEERHTLLDKAKILYQEKLLEGTSKQPTLSGDSSVHSSACAEQLQQGWALKVAKKKGRFNDGQRQYLEEKFKIGQQTGHKADPDQVSIDMRYAKNDDGTRRFKVDEYLSAQQIKSYFSRTSSKLRKINEVDMQAIADQEAYSNTREVVIQECRLTHPILYDTHNICELHLTNKLRKKFSIAMLHTVCEYFRIDVEHLKRTRLKAPYLQLITELVQSCPCSALAGTVV